MAFSLAQAVKFATATSGTTITVTLNSNPATGSLVCCGVLFYDGTSTAPTFSIADNSGAGNSYTVEAHNSGNNNMTSAGYVGQAYLINAPSNADKNIKVTFNKAMSGAGELWVANFSVTGGTASYNSGATDTTSTGTVNTPTIPVSGANSLVWATVADANSANAATGAWTGIDQTFGCDAEYIVSVSANTAVGFAGTGGAVYNAIGMSFSFTASGGGFNPGWAYGATKIIGGAF